MKALSDWLSLAVCANDALTALATYEAVATDIAPVWLVKMAVEPLTANEPVIVTLPVNK